MMIPQEWQGGASAWFVYVARGTELAFADIAAGAGRFAAGAAASDVAEKAKLAATETASTLATQAKQLLNRQVKSGASMFGDVGKSVKRAAEDLESTSPQLANLAYALADHMGSYATDLHGQSVDQLVKKAAGFTRKQPALVV